MCRPSTVADDWVVKGCHIHVDGVELAVKPTHSSAYGNGVDFKKVFRSTTDDAFQIAAQKARTDCLADPVVRIRWIKSLKRGMEFVRGFEGEPASLANGRAYEFRRLIRMLEQYED